MAMDSNQRQTVIDYFEDKFGYIPHCDVCKTKGAMEVFPNIVDTPVSRKDTDYGKTIPMILLICPDCHHFKLFSAGALGII